MRARNKAGIATLALDSFGPRGIGSSVGRQAVLPVRNQSFDAFRALHSASMLVLLGEANDWTGVASCRRWAEAVRAAGHEIDLVTFEDAAHALDYPGDSRAFLPHGESLRECAWIRKAAGCIDLETGAFRRWGPGYAEWFDWRARCATAGMTVASDAGARRAALARVQAFAVEALRRPGTR